MCERNQVIEEVAQQLQEWYPDNANTNAFCAAIRSMKETAPTLKGDCHESVEGL
jgi:hypothetical protein